MAVDFDRLLVAPVVSTFGETVSYTPTVSQPGVAAFDVVLIVDRRWIEEQIAEGVISTRETMATLRLADFAAEPKQGDQVVARGLSLIVHDVQPDGRGAADLILKRAST